MSERLLGNLPPRVKVTILPGRWLPTLGPQGLGGGVPKIRHLVSIRADDPAVAVAFCDSGKILGSDRPGLRDCTRCIERLTSRGLWPLDPC